MIEEALTWTLRGSFPTKCIDYVAETWRELFRFIVATVMRGPSMNTSVGIQNRVTIWRTVDSERDTIEESTSVC